MRELNGLSRSLMVLCVGCVLTTSCGDDGGKGKPIGDPCQNNTDCADRVCHDGVCAAADPTALGGACEKDAECVSFLCEGGKCVDGRKAAGTACLYGEECASGVCSNNVCAANAQPDSGPDSVAPKDAGVDQGQQDKGVDIVIYPDDGVVDLGSDAGCTGPADCNDGLACTNDSCNAQRQCENTLKSGFCKIGNVCYGDGAANPSNTCQACNASSPTVWSATNEGQSCDDQTACTHTDKCVAGSCKGTAYTCSDGISCTVDSCTGQAGAAGCDFSTIAPGTCLLGLGDCYQNGDIDPTNPCQKCDSAAKQTAWTTFAGLGCVTEYDRVIAGRLLNLTFDGADAIVASPVQIFRKTLGVPRVHIAGASVSVGYQEGIATSQALFFNIADLNMLGNGMLLIADAHNNRLRTLLNGTVALYTGSAGGHNDGSLASAQFSTPYGVSVGANNTFYIADMGNHAIRKIDNGTVTTLGSKLEGYLDGPVATAQFRQPHDVAVAPNGDVLVADTQNNCLRKISQGQVSTIGLQQVGACTTVAGSVATAQICRPSSLEVAPSGEIYVWAGASDRYLMRVSGGQVSIVAGGGTTTGFKAGKATETRLVGLGDQDYQLSWGPSGDLYFLQPVDGPNTKAHIVRYSF